MRINKLNISEPFKHDGLSFETMTNLKQLVVLFGKNGAGKSRLLRNIQAHVDLCLQELSAANTIIFHYEKEDHGGVSEKEYKNYKKIKEEHIKNFNNISQREVIEISGIDTEINPTVALFEEEYREILNSRITNPRYVDIKHNCLKILKALCKSDLTHKFNSAVPNEKGYYATHNANLLRNIKLLDLIKSILNDIMNKKLEYSYDEFLVPKLLFDNRDLNIEELSNGETELLAFCMFIAFQTQEQIKNESLNLKGKILLLDEPDIFLHPKAQLDLIEGLKKLVGDEGQIWIATHSLAILSILEKEEIWLMEEGKITSPSISTPGKVLNSLIGQSNLDKLENFLSSQYEWAAIQFALQCLSDAPVENHKFEDPQQNQVIDRIQGVENIKVLDFGAGHGRIGLEFLKREELAKTVYYQALEANDKFKNELRIISQDLQMMSSIQNDKEREVLNNYEKLNEKQYSKFFDRVFLINVLHELPVNKWHSILNAILNCLNDNGKIILLEDQSIPKGELAHEYGFLILNIEEIKILFNLKNNPKTYIHSDIKYKERLTCIEIDKNLASISKDSIKNALERKKTNCKDDIKRLREKKNKDANDGRKNAFFAQLYTNVDMALLEVS